MRTEAVNANYNNKPESLASICNASKLLSSQSATNINITKLDQHQTNIILLKTEVSFIAKFS